MSFSKTPSAGQLRELLPDVATNMEQTLIVNQLKRLKIVYSLKKAKGNLSIVIPLTQEYTMTISPVDIGPGGLKEFFTFVQVPQLRDREGNVLPARTKETIRVHVEVTKSDLGSIDNPFSYTLHERNIEKVIKCALEGLYQTRNLTLTPIEKRLVPKSQPKTPIELQPDNNSDKSSDC